MDSILTSDIFFFITACAVIIITAGLAFLFFHIYRLVKKIDTIADRLSDGVGSFESFIKSIPFLGGVFKKKRAARRARTAAAEE
jgi:hypothetical protein